MSWQVFEVHTVELKYSKQAPRDHLKRENRINKLIFPPIYNVRMLPPVSPNRLSKPVCYHFALYSASKEINLSLVLCPTGLGWHTNSISPMLSVCPQQEEQRSTAAREAWGRRHAWATGQLDSSIWLEAVGARALASEENSRFA